MSYATCVKCGSDAPRLIRGLCRPCYDRERYQRRIAYFRAYYAAHGARMRAYQREYQQRHRQYFARKRREYAVY